MDTEIVKLNVGGKGFMTLKSTLMNSPWFVALLSGKFKTEKINKDVYFIDRDPDIFPAVLNYLRNGKNIHLSYFKGSKHHFDYFVNECDYYGLTWPTVKSKPETLLSVQEAKQEANFNYNISHSDSITKYANYKIKKAMRFGLKNVNITFDNDDDLLIIQEKLDKAKGYKYYVNSNCDSSGLHHFSLLVFWDSGIKNLENNEIILFNNTIYTKKYISKQTKKI